MLWWAFRGEAESEFLCWLWWTLEDLTLFLWSTKMPSRSDWVASHDKKADCTRCPPWGSAQSRTFLLLTAMKSSNWKQTLLGAIWLHLHKWTCSICKYKCLLLVNENTTAIYFGEFCQKKQKKTTTLKWISCQWFLFNPPAGIAGVFWDAGGSEPDQTVRKLLWICTSCPRTADSWIFQMVSADSRAHAVLTLTHNAGFQVDQWGNKRHGSLLFHVNRSI